MSRGKTADDSSAEFSSAARGASTRSANNLASSRIFTVSSGSRQSSNRRADVRAKPSSVDVDVAAMSRVLSLIAVAQLVSAQTRWCRKFLVAAPGTRNLRHRSAAHYIDRQMVTVAN